MINDTIRQKPDPSPNTLHTASTHAHETLLWASKNKSARHTFNYDLINSPNPHAQVSSIWRIPTVSRFEEESAGLAARRIAATGRGSLLREISEQFWSVD